MARLRQDYVRIKRDPIPYCSAEPLPSNMLKWHYCVRGPDDSPYAGGYFHGTLVFPTEFPFKPPSIYMITPNGRFRTNTRLCLSISGKYSFLFIWLRIIIFIFLAVYSDFHPDTWNPAWSVGTILTGLLSFMLEPTPTYGSTECSTAERQRLAAQSLVFNLANDTFCSLFPEICTEISDKLKKHNEEQLKKNNSNEDGAEADEGERMAVAVERQSARSTSMSANLLVLVSFAVFAMLVNYILKSLNNE